MLSKLPLSSNAHCTTVCAALFEMVVIAVKLLCMMFTFRLAIKTRGTSVIITKAHQISNPRLTGCICTLAKVFLQFDLNILSQKPVRCANLAKSESNENLKMYTMRYSTNINYVLH